MGAPRTVSPTTLSGGTPVGGSGTLNTIPRWTGATPSTTLGDSVMVQSGTGIGINVTPAQTFHAYFASGNNGIRIESGTNTASDYAVLRFTQGGGEKAVLYTNLTQTVLKASAGSLDLWGSGENGIRVDGSTGKVGIGTASPPTKLSVLGGIAAHTTFGVYTNMAWLGSFYDATQNKGIGFAYTSGNGNAIQGLGAAGANSDLVLNPYAGHVGIGTASPARKLTVESNLPLRLGTATEYWDFVQNTTNVWGWLSNAGQYSLLMNTATGHVGIGTASPGTKLHVLGGNGIRVTDAVGTAGFDFLNLSNDGYIYNRNNGAMVFGTNNTERARITSSGNVILNAANTGATIQAAGLQQGIKLAPAAAASFNTDPNVLDCYEEGTWTPTLANFVTNTPTASATYTRIGRMVTLNVYIYAGGNPFGSTLGSTTVTVPSGMTPAFTGVGHGGVSRTTGTVAQVIAFYDGKIYIGTTASAATEMFVSVTYYV